MNGWVAFWIFLAVFVICECVIFLNGYDTGLWVHKTPIEKALQEKALKK